MNEFSFIEKVKKLLPAYGNDVIVGIGDDAAVLLCRSDKYLLVTTDTQVEGVHFTRARTNFNKICAGSGKQLGQRAVAVALSDIAAMGGTPKHILVSLVIPKNRDFLEELYEGFGKACKDYGVSLIGGNISSGKQLVIDIFVLGEIDKKHLVLRNGAKVGDAVLLTGALGRKAVVPAARIREGQILARSSVVTSMIDLSDGLSSDLLHICEESAVGVRIFADKLPIAPSASFDAALNGGEDYELCFTASPASTEKLITEIFKKTGTKITVIGEIIDKKDGWWIVDVKGRKKRLEARGFNHLKNF